MRRYIGSEKSPNGVYLNLSRGEFIQVTEAAQVLPGGREVRYIKVPSVLAMVTGPFSGLIFILFLPFIGIAGFIIFLGYKLWQGAVILERKTVRLASFSWQPGKAYFSPRSRRHEVKPAKDKEELNKLEAEITKRKHDEER
jgi:hypothetical protein